LKRLVRRKKRIRGIGNPEHVAILVKEFAKLGKVAKRSFKSLLPPNRA
jgi:hypothetical protein